MERLDDGRDVIGQIDREVTLAVRKLYMHCATVVENRARGKARLARMGKEVSSWCAVKMCRWEAASVLERKRRDS